MSSELSGVGACWPAYLEANWRTLAAWQSMLSGIPGSLNWSNFWPAKLQSSLHFDTWAWERWARGRTATWNVSRVKATANWFMHHPWRPTASLRILEQKLPRSQVVIWVRSALHCTQLGCTILSGKICAWTFFVFPCASMYCISIPVALLPNHGLILSTYWWKHRELLFQAHVFTLWRSCPRSLDVCIRLMFFFDNLGETPQHLACLKAIESLFTSSQRTPPKAHESTWQNCSKPNVPNLVWNMWA